MAEELRGQLAERLPGSVQIFAAAAKDAGKTDGSVAQLNKLMEDGKALAKDLLPFVAARLKDAAKANGALELALKGLNVKLAQSKVGLQIFQEAIFDSGVRGGLSFLLNGFNDLMKSTKPLAKLLGGLFEGAVKGLVTPFRLLYAAIFDVVNLITPDSWNANVNEILKGIGLLVGGVGGLVLSLWGLKKAYNAIKGIKNLLPRGGKNKKRGKPSKGGWSIGNSTGVQEVFVVNMRGGGLGGDLTTGKKDTAFKKIMKDFALVAGSVATAALAKEAVKDFEGGLTSKFGSFGGSVAKSALMLTPLSGLAGSVSQKVEISLKSELLDARVEGMVSDGINKSNREAFNR